MASKRELRRWVGWGAALLGSLCAVAPVAQPLDDLHATACRDLLRSGHGLKKREIRTIDTRDLWFHPGSRIIGRLLSIEPFAYEILDSDGALPSSDSPSQYERRRRMNEVSSVRLYRAVGRSDVPVLKRLHPGDLFEAQEGIRRFGMTITPATYSIRPIERAAARFRGHGSPFRNRSGLVLRIRGHKGPGALSNEFRLYGDGSVVWVDSYRRAALVEHRLSPPELEDMLGRLATLASERAAAPNRGDRPDVSGRRAGLLVVCPDLFEIGLHPSTPGLDGLLDAVDRTVDDAFESTELVLRYERKDRIRIHPWPFPALSPPAQMHLRARRRKAIDEQLGRPWSDAKMRYLRWLEQDPAIRADLGRIRALSFDVLDAPLPEDMRHSLLTVHETDQEDPGQLVFYQFNGRTFQVEMSTFMPGSHVESACTNGTLCALSSTEIYDALNYERAYLPTHPRAIDFWPEEVGTKLESVPQDGLVIPREEYLAHRTFYEHLVIRTSLKDQYIDGPDLFRGVHVEIRERPRSDAQEAVPAASH